MKRPASVLAALLAAQLLLAAGLAAAAARRHGGPADAPFLSFDPKAVDRVVIDGPGGARVELARSHGAWKVASQGGFPAEAGKVERLLSQLAGLRRGDPVATSAEALARFKVADGDHERRIALQAGGKAVATALFGSTAAMRTVHARAEGSGDVHLVEFSTWEVPAGSDGWIDRSVLRVPRGEIEALEVGGVKLERVAPAAPSTGPASGATPAPAQPAWRATGLPRGASLDATAAEALANSVADLSVAGVAGQEPAGGWGLDHPTLALVVRRSGGGTVEYRLARPAGAGDWIVQVSSRPERFRLPAYAAEALQRAADAGTLAGRPPPAPSPASPPAVPAKASAKR